MTKAAVVDTLAQLGREMARAGRAKEESALREAAELLGKLDHGVLTIKEAADKIGMPEQAIEEWISRGGLQAVEIGGRWLVSGEDIASAVRLRETLHQMEREGNPTDEDIAELYSRARNAR
ncbi:MAG TPA: helix-turn-helix domain-containing protein [Chloroflexota bacterium]|nr:helix-turn-helix domain-containing protein [Chloroflexota bacterium]